MRKHLQAKFQVSASHNPKKNKQNVEEQEACNHKGVL